MYGWKVMLMYFLAVDDYKFRLGLFDYDQDITKFTKVAKKRKK